MELGALLLPPSLFSSWKVEAPVGMSGVIWDLFPALHRRRRRRFLKGRNEPSERGLPRDLCKSGYFYANFESTACLVRGKVASLAVSQSSRLIPSFLLGLLGTGSDGCRAGGNR